MSPTPPGPSAESAPATRPLGGDASQPVRLRPSLPGLAGQPAAGRSQRDRRNEHDPKTRKIRRSGLAPTPSPRQAPATPQPETSRTRAAGSPPPPSSAPAADKYADIPADTPLIAQAARPGDAGLEPALDALRAAQRWVNAGPSLDQALERLAPTASPPMAEPATARRQPSDPPTATPPQRGAWPSDAQGPRTAAPRSQPLTRVEIGSIEVEVIAPAKPAAQPTPRPVSRRSGPVGAGLRGAPSFGWRQR